MGFEYTKEQEKVIYTTGSNILVSAAAGSGKTAVLVQRIIKMVADKKRLVSMDELLIVTFTKAAASEMRERIASGIENAIENESDEIVINHLIKQLALLSTANIMTMHSFCLKILKSYYHLIGLDPTFRIGSETELVLIREEVIDDLLEEEYAKQDDGFIQVIESFADGKNDNRVKELIYKIYNFSMSNPWPDKWLDESLSMLTIRTPKDYEESPYYQIIVSSVKDDLFGIPDMFKEIDELMLLNEGPDKYKDTVEVLFNWYEAVIYLITEGDYNKIKEITEQTKIPTLSRKTKGYDKELATQAKDLIDNIKMLMKSIDKLYYDEESIITQTESINRLINELVRLTRNFKRMFREEKDDKNIIDFNDFEHFVLELLYTDGEASSIAKSYQEQFVEVLVDEYQDTNEVQEAIITALSKKNNLFMVGDLKQSIYKFRLAKPEIFREKYDIYDYEDSVNIKIDLAKNFRSRREVLRFTNEVFEKVMSKTIGDVNYDKHAKLYYGSMDYQEESINYIPELIIAEVSDKNQSKELLQGEIIAGKIHDMISNEDFMIFDKELGIRRQIMYKDICVLMRSPSTTIRQIKDVFDKELIPYSADVSSGFFDTVEVSIILNVLRLIDNPYQDIPLASVLRSGIVGLNEKEMLTIREFNKDCTYYEALLGYIDAQLEIKDNNINVIADKGRRFLANIKRLQELSLHMSLDILIQKIYTDTGFPYFVRFMENGEQRLTNLKYLQVQAKSFEQSSYKGLFNFIRYIEHIKKYEIKVPEPLTIGADSGVTLLSIHKSKGLEFPVVFIIGLHKEFNMIDLKQNFMLHQELGFACDYFDPERRLRMESGFSKALKISGARELLSEELRLFYVALTRAREKLILIGVVKDIDKSMETQLKYSSYINEIPFTKVAKAKSYLDLILMSCPPDVPWYDKLIYDQEIKEQEQGHVFQLINERKLAKIDMLTEALKNEKEITFLDEMTKEYKYVGQTKKYVTMSVSELKENQSKEKFNTKQYEIKRNINGDKEINLSKSSAKLKKNKVLKGAEYGLIMHKVLSMLPPKPDYTYNEISEFVTSLFDKEIIEEEFRGKVYIKSIKTFTASKFYERIVEAAINKKLFVEQPFVLGIKDNEDLRMIQGVIDLYFEEEGQFILLDYKTDYIEEGQEQVLVDRYKIQLDYYKKALEDITGKKVVETYIYSLSTEKLIEC